jgi:hypothetical protein
MDGLQLAASPMHAHAPPPRLTGMPQSPSPPRTGSRTEQTASLHRARAANVSPPRPGSFRISGTASHTQPSHGVALTSGSCKVESGLSALYIVVRLYSPAHVPVLHVPHKIHNATPRHQEADGSSLATKMPTKTHHRDPMLSCRSVDTYMCIRGIESRRRRTSQRKENWCRIISTHSLSEQSRRRKHAILSRNSCPLGLHKRCLPRRPR